MPTSTTDATSSLLIKARDLRATGANSMHPQRRYPARLANLSSPAGLHPRPWLKRLRRALREDLFVLHYQPIRELASGQVSHYEALIRLADDPDASPLTPPCAFLPAAERYGLIQDIDRMVIGKVVALMGGELADNGARVAVNLSALSIVDAEMLGHIERELARHRVAARRLTLEITETAAISDMACAQAFCEGAVALGCPLALDDFGVGFGSFYYIKRLPFSYLKIDGEFIRELCGSEHDRLMVKALVDVARGMGKQTIAEYVGDEDTIELAGRAGRGRRAGLSGRAAPSVDSLRTPQRRGLSLLADRQRGRGSLPDGRTVSVAAGTGCATSRPTACREGFCAGRP